MLTSIPDTARRVFAVLLAIALALTTLVMGGMPSAHAEELATTTGFSGTITDALTSAPIEGAWVDTWTEESQSDADGNYLKLVPPGTYMVDYYNYSTTATVPFGYAASRGHVVDVPEGEPVSGVDVELMPNGRISGTVNKLLDGATVPFEDVSVVVFEPNTQDGNYYLQIPRADGTYEIDVPPGSYNVAFSDFSSTSNLGTQWFDQVADNGDATTVNVTAKQELPGIDALFNTTEPPAPAVQVTGAVVAKDSAGVALDGVKVYLQADACGEDGPGVWENTTATSKGSSGFGISLTEGVYCATVKNVPAGYEIPAPTTVTVAAPSPVWITLWITGNAPVVPASVTGAVVAKDGAGVGLDGVKVLLEADACGEAGPGVWQNTTATSKWSQGGFGISLTEGVYCATVQEVPAGYEIPEPLTVTVTAPSPVWITLWIAGEAPVVPVTVTGAVVAKDGAGVGIDGVKVLIEEGACEADGAGVWENTTATSRWSQGGFGISLTEGTYCATVQSVPAGFTAPEPFTVEVAAPSPVWITAWIPRA